MSAVWTTVFALALATAVIRSAGPVGLGGRDLPRPAMNVIALMAAALLAGLVVVETFGGDDRSLELDARVFGVGAAGAVLAWRSDALLLAVAVAAVVAALARAVA